VLNKLRIVHRDLSPQERQRLDQKRGRATELLKDLERGELMPEDLDADTRERLIRLLSR